MSSENGSKELVSLLQYMKNTTLDNPEIQVRDERDIAMTKGVELGAQQGIQQGIQKGEMGKLIKQVCKKLVKGYSVEEIADIFEEDEAVIQKIADVEERYAMHLSTILIRYMRSYV